MPKAIPSNGMFPFPKRVKGKNKSKRHQRPLTMKKMRRRAVESAHNPTCFAPRRATGQSIDPGLPTGHKLTPWKLERYGEEAKIKCKATHIEFSNFSKIKVESDGDIISGSVTLPEGMLD